VSTVLVDTSAVLALLVPTDVHHKRARRAFTHLATDETRLMTTSYTMVECYALIGRRLGLDAVRRFRVDFAPLLEVVWVGSDEHERGLDLLEESRSAKLSLVDAVAFVVARDRDVERVFAFDPHFTKAGFATVG
jgi:predicted nucleic acid-binding protein